MFAFAPQTGDIPVMSIRSSWSDRLRLAPVLGLFIVFSLTIPRTSVGGGTVAEQRARLPPPAKCTDPVAGVWKSHTYHPDRSTWSEFSLSIRRSPDAPNRLVGDIKNDSWEGTEDKVNPPPCDQIPWRAVVSMDAEGEINGMDLRFGGVGQWRLDETICGVFAFSYNLDNFSGTIDPELQEFQSVNNDGGVSVNEPTVFRRIQCFDSPVSSQPVDPPPFEPPRGCGCAR